MNKENYLMKIIINNQNDNKNNNNNMEIEKILTKNLVIIIIIK